MIMIVMAILSERDGPMGERLKSFIAFHEFVNASAKFGWHSLRMFSVFWARPCATTAAIATANLRLFAPYCHISHVFAFVPLNFFN